MVEDDVGEAEGGVARRELGESGGAGQRAFVGVADQVEAFDLGGVAPGVGACGVERLRLGADDPLDRGR